MSTPKQNDLTGLRRVSLAEQNRADLAERDRKAGIVPRSNSQAGDFTGREKERLASENAKEVAAAQKRVGLVNQIDTVIEEEGTFDALSGSHTLSPDAEAKIQEIQEISYASEDGDTDAFDVNAPTPADPMRDFRATETAQAEKVVVPNPSWLREEPEVEVIDSPTKRFRVNTDVEEMTYGRDPVTMDIRILTLVRGRWYTGPVDLYQHLESRGLIYH